MTSQLTYQIALGLVGKDHVTDGVSVRGPVHKDPVIRVVDEVFVESVFNQTKTNNINSLAGLHFHTFYDSKHSLVYKTGIF